jgi:type II secretory pathway component PulK
MFRAADTPEDQARAFQLFEEELGQLGEQSAGPATFQVAALDLGSRVDLNNAGEDVLRGLFTELFGERTAEPLVAALTDWVDADDEPEPGGAEAAHYARAGSPFRPTNQPMLRLEELTRVQGFSDSVANVLAPFVTVWGDGRVNVNTAPPEVLAAVPGLGTEGAEFVVAARQRDGVLVSRLAVSQQLAEMRGNVGAQLGAVAAVPSRILIVSRGWAEGHSLTHEIQAVLEIVRAFLDSPMRLRIRHWTERDL